MKKSAKSRDLSITKQNLRKAVAVYNGKTITHFIVKKGMMTHKMGEFVLTKYMGKLNMILREVVREKTN